MELERFIAEQARIIAEQERFIAEQSKKICVLEGYLMRKHTVEGRVHTSSQTEAAPVFYVNIPTPPKEGAPRNVNARHHRRYKTCPLFQGEMSFESSDKKGFSLGVGIQDEDVSKSISLSRQKKSKGFHRSVQRLALCDNRDSQTTEILPPISLTKETPPFLQFNAGTLSLDMTPTCKPEINNVTH